MNKKNPPPARLPTHDCPLHTLLCRMLSYKNKRLTRVAAPQTRHYNEPGQALLRMHSAAPSQCLWKAAHFNGYTISYVACEEEGSFDEQITVAGAYGTYILHTGNVHRRGSLRVSGQAMSNNSTRELLSALGECLLRDDQREYKMWSIPTITEEQTLRQSLDILLREEAPVISRR